MRLLRTIIKYTETALPEPLMYLCLVCAFLFFAAGVFFAITG
jgi:hypothetical protein